VEIGGISNKHRWLMGMILACNLAAIFAVSWPAILFAGYFQLFI